MRKLIIILALITFVAINVAPQDNTMKIVEESANFQGHDLNYFWSTFVKANLQYPDSSLVNHIEGKVIVAFVVDSTGLIKDTKVLRSLNRSCDKEAIRVVNLSSGMWNPGMVKGKKVNQAFVIPVEFTILKNVNHN